MCSKVRRLHILTSNASLTVALCLAQVWIVAATRAALPPNGTDYVKYSNNALSHRSLALNAGTYLGGLLSVLGQQTGNIDIQVGSPHHRLLEGVMIIKRKPTLTYI